MLRLRIGQMNAALTALHDRVLSAIWTACDAYQQEALRGSFADGGFGEPREGGGSAESQQQMGQEGSSGIGGASAGGSVQQVETAAARSS